MNGHVLLGLFNQLNMFSIRLAILFCDDAHVLFLDHTPHVLRKSHQVSLDRVHTKDNRSTVKNEHLFFVRDKIGKKKEKIDTQDSRRR